MIFISYHLQGVQYGNGSLGFRTDRHRQHIDDNIFGPDSIFRCLPDNLSGNLHPPLGCVRDSLFIQRKSDHNAAVFLYERKDHIHGLLLAADRIDHGLSVVNPHSSFHRLLIHRINLKWETGNSLQFSYDFFHHGWLVNIRKAYIHIQNMRALFLLPDSFF